ncbi:norbelladine synthase-like [Corylus avellana]|uniref:norbelladine synthase-like n=1 Tax=Corylus avellana TaxID=13451 RepID=UPI00286ADA5C|nr:norbelladine synthase-like [Corylus avellana]
MGFTLYRVRFEIIENGDNSCIIKSTIEYDIKEEAIANGTPGFTSYSEKFTKVDHENRLKETEVIEGGYLDMGFTLYRIRFEIFEKGDDSCIIKATVEYDVKEEVAANASYVTIEPLVTIIELTKNYLIKSKAAKDAN